MDVFSVERIIENSRASDASLEELLACERLLFDLSARFANVSGDQVDAEIESTLRQLLRVLGFDRSNFAEFADGGQQSVLYSAAVEGVEPFQRGQIPAYLSWFVRELLSGRTIVIRSYEEFPPEAAAEAEYYRRVGIRSQLAIPLRVGGRVVGAIGFGAFRSTREWPDELIARLKVVGEVMAQALVRKRSEAVLRASEERWRSIFETSNLGITIIDQDLHYVATNPAFQAMLGYTDEELRELTTLSLAVEEDREVTRTRLTGIRQGKLDHYEVVRRYRRKDGTVMWGHSYLSVVRDAESKPKMFIGTTIDITETKRAQDALRATQARLSRTTRLTTMGQMAASIAHELNQPLAAIVANGDAGLVFLTSSTPNPDAARESLKDIVGEGHRASQIIGSIRAMFKKNAQDKTSVNVNDLIREVLSVVRSELENERVSLRAELAENLPEVFADRVQLQQVLVNLVVNAIEAMNSVTDRERILRIKSATSGSSHDVRITVEDSGVGIDPDDMDNIFDAFFTTKSRGMGMGLSICRSIIEAHNGRLWASPAVDHGSAFEVHLPTTGADHGTGPAGGSNGAAGADRLADEPREKGATTETTVEA